MFSQGHQVYQQISQNWSLSNTRLWKHPVFYGGHSRDTDKLGFERMPQDRGCWSPKSNRKETPVQEAGDGDTILRQAAALPHMETAPSLFNIDLQRKKKKNHLNTFSVDHEAVYLILFG